MDTPKRRGLGRGLSALLPASPSRLGAGSGAPQAPAAVTAPRAEGYFLCPVEAIRPNAQQPRRHFAEAELASLAESIAARGVLQPVIVRRLPVQPGEGGASYELIAGERRWRAARRAGLAEIPALVKEVSGRDLLELALVENLQREDLNPLEVAEAYRSLVEEFGLTQEEVARRVGRQRSTVANHLRLLRLPPEVKQALESGAVTMGHARAVLGIEDPKLEVEAFRRVLAEGLSVRQTERLVQQLRRGRGRRSGGPAVRENRTLIDISERLQRSLGTRVEIRGRGGRGRIIISYYSDAELDRLLEYLQTPGR